jgi:hypothetical protein
MQERYSHPTNDRASDQRLDASNNSKDDRSDPDELPVPPLNGHRIHSGDKVDSDDINQRPEQSEAEHAPGIVQVDRLRAAHRERPVQAWEFGWRV